MNEDLLQDLFNLMPEGIFESPEEMKPVIESEGIDGFFDQMPDGAFFDIKEYQSFFKGLKKKENSQLPVLGKKDSELVGEVVTTDALLDSNEPSSEPKSEENKFWFEQLLGNIPVASGAADFYGDMIRAGQQGYAQGQSVDDAIRLFAKAANASEEDIDAYISAVEKMEAFPESDEMKEFSKLYQEGGGGIYGFMKGIIPNPSVINQVFTSSIVSMMNPTVLGGAATGAVTGAGVGAAVGAAGGPLAAFTGAGGAMTGAMMGAGGTLEVGLSFTEFLKEEIDEKGLEFNKESVKEVLEDPEALQRIRNKSAARGVIIGLVDGITMGVAGEVGATVTKAAIKAGKAAVVSGAKGVATATVIEGVGGSAGEAIARAATGQEMEASDIIFEGVAGQVSTFVKSGPKALGIDVNVTKPGSFLRPPSYSMTGEPQTKADIEVFIETMTPEQIRTADITIKNDPELQAKVDYLKQRAQTDLTISEDIVGEDRNTMIDLEMQILNMKDPKTESSKIKLQNLKDQIRVIIERNGKTEEQKNREKAAGDYKKTETTVTSTEVNTKAETDTEVSENLNEIDLGENETIIENREVIVKGEKLNLTIIEQTSEKDGIKTTKYQSNRSNKSSDQRGDSSVSPETVLNENEEINLEENGLEDLEDGGIPEVTKVFEVREDDNGTKAADIEFTVTYPDGTKVNDRGTVKITQKAKEAAVEKPVLTKSKTNAVQESSTTQVDVQESTQDSKEMGIGNISSKPTGESNIETESEVTETEETEIENVLESPKLQEALTSEVMDDSERKNILLKARRKAIEEGQEESRLYSNIMSAINREAKTEGINANEYIKAEVIEDSLPTASRERVNKVIDNIIKKTKERRDNLGGEKATLAELFSNTSSYLQQSKLYEQLNDVEREAAIRELNERLGIKEKRAPSSRKVAMGTDKKVVVNERVALKDQIKLEAKAARESAQAYKKSLKDTATYVKGLVKKGLINTKQAAAILAKQANVNVFNQKSVDSFIEYVDNVFNKAELADKISRSKDLKSKAKKNVGGAKTGNIPQGLKTVLEDLFSISPYLVPLNKIDAYLSLLEQFGSNKKTLDLEQRSETMEIAQDVLNAVQEQIETNEDGSMVNFEIVKSKKKNYDLGAVTNEIIENKITEEEIENLTGEKSKEVARKINELTAQEIAGLSKEKSDGSFNYGMIETLREVKNNLKNGFAPKAAFDIITEVESNNSVKPLVPIFNKIKKTSVYRHFRSFSSSIKTKLELGPSAGNFVLDRIRSMPAFFVDDVLGNFNSKDVYNATFKKMAVAYSSFETEVKTIRSLVNEADVLLDYDGLKGRKFLRIGRSRNKVVKAKYKLMLVQLTREHLSNYKKNKEGEYVGNPKAPSGEAFLDVTIKDGKLNSADIKILEELKEEFLSGDPKVDLKKLEKSLSESEKKALKIYGDINGSLSEKAIYVSSQLHGEKINLINDYVHHSAINTGDPGADVIGKKTRFQNAAINTKAGTIVERTNGAKPISFDPSYSAMRGAQETLVDYYMTPTNRVVQKTINKLNDIIEDNPNNTKEAKQAAKAIKSAMNEINGLLFEKTFTDVSIGNEALRELQSLGYKAALSSAPRAGAELVGNVLLVAKNPILATKALTNFSAFANGITDNSMAMNAMAKLQSSETSRLYDSNTINNKYSDLGNFMGTSQSSGKALTPVLSMGNQILKLGSKQLYASVDYIATKILTTPDKAISRPMWFGTFQAVFSEATKKYNGESVELTVKDFKEIADGTSPYLSPKFERAVEAARNSADKSSVTISTSSNPYNSIFKNIRRKDSSGLKNAYRVANSYMANFSLFEYGTARNALYSLVNSGDMSSEEALKVLIGVTARMSSYMVMYTLLTQLMDEELFGVEDDDSEEDFEYLIARQLVGAGVSLVSRGQLGNIPLIPFNMLIEEGNERFGEELRDGEEYNKYKHSLVFNQIGKQDLQEKDLANNLIGLAAGPFGPMWKTLSRSAELLQRTQTGGDVARKKAMDELTTRMAVEVSGNLGLFPFYKDYRRIMLKSMFGTKPYTPAKSKKGSDPWEEFDDNTDSGGIDTWDELEEKGYDENQSWDDFEENSNDTWSDDSSWED